MGAGALRGEKPVAGQDDAPGGELPLVQCLGALWSVGRSGADDKGLVARAVRGYGPLIRLAGAR